MLQASINKSNWVTENEERKKKQQGDKPIGYDKVRSMKKAPAILLTGALALKGGSLLLSRIASQYHRRNRA